MTLVRLAIMVGIFLVSGTAMGQETDSFTYDALGRVTSTSRSVNSSISSYTGISYDNADNRTCLATSVGATNSSCPSSGAWSSSLTAGTSSSPYVVLSGYSAGVTGSMTNTYYNGFTVLTLESSNAVSVFLTMNGTAAPPNSGWTSITVPGEGTLLRTAASYSVSGTQATWTWSNSGHSVSSGLVTIQ